MDFIKDWAIGLVVVGIVGTIVLVLSPSGSMQKQVRTAVSLFLLFAFVHPFLSGVDFNIESNESLLTTVNDSDVRNSIEMLMSRQTESQIYSILSENNIDVKDVKAVVELNSENELQIKKVTIVVNGYSDKSRIKKLINDALNISVDFEVE